MHLAGYSHHSTKQVFMQGQTPHSAHTTQMQGIVDRSPTTLISQSASAHIDVRHPSECLRLTDRGAVGCVMVPKDLPGTVCKHEMDRIGENEVLDHILGPFGLHRPEFHYGAPRVCLTFHILRTLTLIEVRSSESSLSVHLVVSLRCRVAMSLFEVGLCVMMCSYDLQ